MANPTARLTHKQIIDITLPGVGKERECPVCGHLHLQLFGEDDFACQGPDHCDATEIAKRLWAKIDRRDNAKQKSKAAEPTGPGLTVEAYAAAKKLNPAWLRSIWRVTQTRYRDVPAIEFPYTWIGVEGDTVNAFKSSARYRWSMESKPVSKSGSNADLYGQEQLHLYQAEQDEPTKYCFLVEGESDTQTLMWLGFPALGVPGIPQWQPAWAHNPFLEGRQILVMQEPDKDSNPPTYKLADSWTQKIAKTFPPGTVRAVRLPHEKDVSLLWTNISVAHEFDENDEAAVDHFQEELCKAVEASTVVQIAGEKPVAPFNEIADVLASGITMKLTRWLWKDHVPLHHVTVFAGMPQKGKSTAACDLIARLTTGANFPLARNTLEPCEVAILATEDDKDETIVPRLVAAGANLDRVRFPFPVQQEATSEWEIALDRDLPLLKTYLQARPAVRLLVIDPVTSYIGEVDPNKPKEVRPFLNKLKTFAKEMDITVMLIMHLSKNPDVSALHRVGGAATWIEVPRAVWFFDLKPDQEDGVRPLIYVMVNGKLNLVADDQKKSLEYQFTSVDVPIEDEVASIGRIQWGSASDLELDGLYKKDRQKPGPEPKKTEAAKAWLQTFLADGEKLAADVFVAGAAAGHRPDTLRDAQKLLGIAPHREFANKGRWLWQLPGVAEETEQFGEIY
jgi:hypothetical protein